MGTQSSAHWCVSEHKGLGCGGRQEAAGSGKELELVLGRQGDDAPGAFCWSYRCQASSACSSCCRDPTPEVVVGAAPGFAGEGSLPISDCDSAISDETLDACAAYHGFEALSAVLNAGDVVLLRGSWLVKTSRRLGSLLPCRQDLPEGAALDPRAAVACPIVVVSHCWASPAHPDPRGEQLRLLGGVLEQWLAWEGSDKQFELAVFFDWCSLYQEPRNSQQRAAYARSLQHMNVWYAHEKTSVWMLTKAPAGTPGFGDRGWTCFERAASQLRAPARPVLDLGLLQGPPRDWPSILEACRVDRLPPALPEVLCQELERKHLTRPGDCDLLERKYREAFEELLSSTRLLEVGGPSWGGDEARRLAEVLPRCPRLRELRLRDSQLDDAGARRLADALPRCRRLRTLDLSGNDVLEAGAARLAEALPACGEGRVRSLDLTGNGVGDGGAGRLAVALPSCQALRRLLLGRNEVGDVGAEELAAFLPRCAGLQILDMRENEVADAGAAWLATALPRCPGLRRFDLSGNRVGDAGAEALAAVLPQCHCLQDLGLGDSDVGEILGGGRLGDKGAEALAAALPSCPRLRRLKLSGNRVGDAGLERLAAVLSSCACLTVLDLHRNLASQPPKAAGRGAAAGRGVGEDGQSLAGAERLREAWRRAGKLEAKLLLD